MLRYMLDTNIVIFIVKRRPVSLLDIFRQHEGRIAISTITVAEFLHGAEKSADPERNIATVEDFRSRLSVLDYGEMAAGHYGSIKAALEKAGCVIGVNDMHIAAHAGSEGLTLITNNLREFERVPGLLVKDWVRTLQ